MIARIVILLTISVFSLFSCDTPVLDEYGGYYDEKLQVYRYMKVGRNLESVKGLVKPFPGKRQTIEAKVVRITGNMVWIHIVDRNIYTLLTQDVAYGLKDEKESLAAVALEGISLNPLPAKSTAINKKKQAAKTQIIDKVMLSQVVPVTLEIKQKALSGVVFLPGSDGKSDSQSLNYWLIKNGLSPYILPRNQEPPNPNYIKAEDIARKNKSGIWSR